MPLGPVGRCFHRRTLRDEAMGVKHPSISIADRNVTAIVALDQ